MGPVRSEQKWKERSQDTWIKKLFTPRLQRDLQNLSTPARFPELDLEDGEGLFLYGKVETGKTVFAAQLMLEIKKQWWLEGNNQSLQFITLPQIFSQLKNSFNSDSIEEAKILHQYQDTDLLVLDDLGLGGKASDWLINTLYLLINYRYEYLKPTIYTSNKSLDELAQLFNDVRITSRIERSCQILEKQSWDHGK